MFDLALLGEKLFQGFDEGFRVTQRLGDGFLFGFGGRGGNWVGLEFLAVYIGLPNCDTQNFCAMFSRKLGIENKVEIAAIKQALVRIDANEIPREDGRSLTFVDRSFPHQINRICPVEKHVARD